MIKLDPIKSQHPLRMEALLTLSRQPLFRLMAAFIVLLLADMRLEYGAAGAIVWIVWVYLGHHPSFLRAYNKGW